MKIILLFCVLFTFWRCSFQKECDAVDYSKFGIDTLLLNSNALYLHGKDTFEFKVYEFYTISEKTSSSSFSSMEGCANGYHLANYNETIGLFISSYFVEKEGMFEYGVYSNGLFTKRIKNVLEKKDLGFEITINNKGSFIKSLRFEKGRIVSFEDSLGQVWNDLD
ncbi:hypothetical protein [Saprospira grandis]|uniref:hypothetical protein n=1 Tax=Saprospira grandis TaxID=1008 RepID=UPI0022DE2DE4|nr:hypothetical protein [Saprospira grandis]WBM74411.1 hypothetical protein OP864_15605 [Saprospira grandis]